MPARADKGVERTPSPGGNDLGRGETAPKPRKTPRATKTAPFGSYFIGKFVSALGWWWLLGWLCLLKLLRFGVPFGYGLRPGGGSEAQRDDDDLEFHVGRCSGLNLIECPRLLPLSSTSMANRWSGLRVSRGGHGPGPTITRLIKPTQKFAAREVD